MLPQVMFSETLHLYAGWFVDWPAVDGGDEDDDDDFGDHVDQIVY